MREKVSVMIHIIIRERSDPGPRTKSRAGWVSREESEEPCLPRDPPTLYMVYHFWMRIFSGLVPTCAAMSFLRSPIVSSSLHFTLTYGRRLAR